MTPIISEAIRLGDTVRALGQERRKGQAMATSINKHRKPQITLTRSESEKLRRLAESYADRDPQVSEELLAEIERGRIVVDERIAANVIRMGSTLHFISDLGEDRRVMLVFPGEADIAAGKVSILTPIGAALIGLSAGQSIDWTARDGRVHRLTVEAVEAPGTVTPPQTPVERQTVS